MSSLLFFALWVCYQYLIDINIHNFIELECSKQSLKQEGRDFPEFEPTIGLSYNFNLLTNLIILYFK